MITADRLKVEFSAKALFSDVSFVLNPRERVALVGKNGAGKSTLLKILAGLQLPTEGNVSSPTGTAIGYLPQVMDTADTLTVRQEAEKAFEELRRTGQQADELGEQIAKRTDCDSPSYLQLVDDFAHLSERFALIGGLNYEAELERTLLGLGFLRTDLDRPTAEFSGGWRMRIELAKILLRKPDILLLDEPTNHLDIQSIQWLEQFLVARPGSLMLVSHDRAFLNNVTTRTMEISCGKLYDYRAPYDHFVALRRERREQQLRAYENQQKEIADTRAFIERFRYQATKAVQVQSRIKQLAKIVPIEVDEEDKATLRLRFAVPQRSGDFPLICQDVEKAYDHTVFKGVNLTLRRGDKVAFAGRNGEGKTTLVKCIMGQTPFKGTVKLGHNVSIGYFAQNQAQLLDPSLTVFDTIDREARGPIRTKIRDILGAFMFGGEQADKKVKVLSGGERTRLAMIKLLLQPVNFLILDEPTNHLDMRSKDVLKEAIATFEGTAIIVSHDRDFLDGLVTRVYEFANQAVREHIGGIYDFTALNARPEPPSQAAAPKAPSPTRLTYEEQKARARRQKKLEREVAEVEQAIAHTEQAIAIIEASLASPDARPAPDLYDKHASLKRQLDAHMQEWERLSQELEAAQE